MRKTSISTRLAVLIPLLLGAAPTTEPARPAPIITRADFAEAYHRAEGAFQDHPPRDAEARTQAHRAMDLAMYHFFSGNHSEVIRTMNELSARLREAGGDAEERIEGLERLMWSVKVRVSPRVAHRHRPSILNIRFAPLYEEPGHDAAIEARLMIRGTAGDRKVVFEQPLTLRPGAALPQITTRQPDAPPGSYDVVVASADGHEVRVARWFVVEQSLDIKRDANERRLTNWKAPDPKLLHALVACRSRNGLLTDRPSEQDLSQYLPDPVVLAREVGEEVEALENGRDPYDRRVGDYWRGIAAGAMYLPARVYAPEKFVRAGKPMPIVIALHGAAGDESLFLDGYGAGRIKRLADEHGFLVVAPSTYWVMPNPASVDGIVRAMGMNYEIDPARVYVIGHSLGAIAGAGMAQRQPDRLAAACLIAGGSLDGATKVCPTLVIAAALDPVMLPATLKRDAEAATARRLPVEFRLLEGAGHILVVADALDEAVEWLLKHKLAG